MKVAIAQLTSTLDKTQNLQKAVEYVGKAKAAGADFVIFPEMYSAAATPKSGVRPSEVAEPLDGPFVSGLAQAAREQGIYVVCGVYESIEGDQDRAYNTTVFFNRSGELIKAYRKTHLYDAFSYMESDYIAAGNTPYEIIETEFGKIGLIVCYEVRFPEIARQFALQGADLLFVPAGWVAGPMKEDHWETLVRTRAIENTMFVCAADQVGNIFAGRSMIVDPMGVIVASAGEEETLLVAELDLDRIQRVRGKLPSVANRRPELYTN
ncbi:MULTISPECIES: carbon-nitrogen hydrolase family protein [Brevibacillus]|uniref:Carbon-nitrogen hydrolase family protein n=1 Tax=Brevibacillus invocatus TaxID=173959 RepID=A0A3M8CHG4_9BACL|nr:MULTISPECIES: carbon-nitrogen hydrolase family protein [Brevibacillus]MCM3082085.1 carbon-nitrogen hydrolase family protein [Brevibacillus invocatus]MCM3432496.1 carbon-nitrogen hydrolase family protein [Brevibacillus invocatus]MDH4619052.1 carbon-nitrogen hydrolase family protein [Brevibacillus sp. AY1]RNB74255.1 carbon-nitrogen hydrolase family protein [Brevibacillus invocatus]